MSIKVPIGSRRKKFQAVLNNVFWASIRNNFIFGATKIARHENAADENAGVESAGPQDTGHENRWHCYTPKLLGASSKRCSLNLV